MLIVVTAMVKCHTTLIFHVKLTKVFLTRERLYIYNRNQRIITEHVSLKGKIVDQSTKRKSTAAIVLSGGRFQNDPSKRKSKSQVLIILLKTGRSVTYDASLFHIYAAQWRNQTLVPSAVKLVRFCFSGVQGGHPG